MHAQSLKILNFKPLAKIRLGKTTFLNCSWRYFSIYIKNAFIFVLSNSVADPECFYADPDPTFHADADPAPDLDPKLL